MSDIVQQNAPTKRVKALGSNRKYSRQSEKGTFPFGIPTLSDARKTEDKAQTGMLSGRLIGTLSSRSVFHTLIWLSRREKRTVSSVTSAEVLGTSVEAEEGFLLKSAYC